ncbi:mitochondrial genome maintenance exonuclease 1 isoform X1 [Megachile rotundata]|uniref:mitochondrial genome maintenance exonuclease 1 isoform X1 n=1 Tax=Megachile rotundata TaxID=143995 RepID=UPI003FD2D57C
MFQFCIRNLEFAYDKVNKVNGKQTIHLFMCKHDVKFLYTSVHHESGSNKVTSESNDNVDCPLPEEINAQGSKQNKKLLKLQANKLFKIKEDFQSFPILGSAIPDDYGILYEGTDKNLKVPSVTHILNQTMPFHARKALEIWKKGIIDEFGEEYFKEFSAGLLSDGKLFHSCIESILQGNEEVEVSPKIELAYSSVKPVLKNITSVEATETPVTHPMLRYRGIVDCIACYGNDVCVIDWKTSKKPKTKLRETYDAPVQLAAYIGAINASQQYPSPIDKGLVVIGYTDGKDATVHVLEKDTLQEAWKEWLKRLEQYYINLNKKQEEK